MKKIILTTIVSLLSLSGFSQKGKVVDPNGEVLPCATIEIPSQGKTYYTNFDGYYDIDVPEGTELIITYISYQTKKIVSKNDMVIKLDEYSFFE